MFFTVQQSVVKGGSGQSFCVYLEKDLSPGNLAPRCVGPGLRVLVHFDCTARAPKICDIKNIAFQHKYLRLFIFIQFYFEFVRIVKRKRVVAL